MMVFHDVPRRYKPNGKCWVHVFSYNSEMLRVWGRELDLKRWDNEPFPHWDVTVAELQVILETETIVPMDSRSTALFIRQMRKLTA